ncbi:MAG: decaprenyl-phosphate phosphoribosyltransferase [Vicinamibacteria bacterium]|nr:decaprenyl-phosphate phosphoribosyltransferase [Vicinamibacteria bacterium]
MSKLSALLISLRPHQWTKNLFVFAALIFDKHLFVLPAVLRTFLAFLLFCALSGAVYLINDIADIERDRQHPRKRLRPIARGALSPGTATAAAVALIATALLASAYLGSIFVLCSAAYVLLNILYSFKLKNIVIMDAISVSFGFVIRPVAGAVAIPVAISDWLLICALLLALFLTMCKRRHELTLLNAGAMEHRAILSEYDPYFLDQMIAVVTASSVTAYAIYTTAPATIEKFQTHRLTWTIPFVLYGIFRYLYLVHRKDQGGSPTDLLLADRPLMINVALWGLAVVLILYTAGEPSWPWAH